MINIGKKVRNGISGLALALSIACGNPIDRYEEGFRGSFTDPVTDSTRVVAYRVQKDSTGTPLEIDVFPVAPKGIYLYENEDSEAYRMTKIARFEGATAKSLYSRLVPKVFEAYKARKE